MCTGVCMHVRVMHACSYVCLNACVCVRYVYVYVYVYMYMYVLVHSKYKKLADGPKIRKAAVPFRSKTPHNLDNKP